MATIAHLSEARSPEDVFGELEGTPEEQLTQAAKVYHELARAFHPDVGGDDEDFKRLNAVWSDAQKAIKLGLYGTRSTAASGVTISSRRHTYRLDHRVGVGDIADLYLAKDEEENEVGIKIVRSPRNNDLIENEYRTLQQLTREEQYPFFPLPLDSLTIREKSGGANRRAIVTDPPPADFYSLAQVARAYPKGIDPRDMAWMWRRVLVALGASHQAEVVHGAVLPDRILVHPIRHELVLIDWTASSRDQAPISLVSSRYRAMYPSEVVDKKPASPGTDIYLGAMTMKSLLGEIPRPMRAHFRACTLPGKQRSDDALRLLESFDDLLERMYGARKYRPFSMPNERM